MSNLPTLKLPIIWCSDNATIIHYNGSKLVIFANGEIRIEGSIKDAALGLVKQIEREYIPGLISIELNRAVDVNCENGFSISYRGDKKPEFWDDFSAEFDRIVKMKIFW